MILLLGGRWKGFFSVGWFQRYLSRGSFEATKKHLKAWICCWCAATVVCPYWHTCSHTTLWFVMDLGWCMPRPLLPSQRWATNKVAKTSQNNVMANNYNIGIATLQKIEEFFTHLLLVIYPSISHMSMASDLFYLVFTLGVALPQIFAQHRRSLGAQAEPSRSRGYGSTSSHPPREPGPGPPDRLRTSPCPPGRTHPGRLSLSIYIYMCVCVYIYIYRDLDR